MSLDPVKRNFMLLVKVMYSLRGFLARKKKRHFRIGCQLA